MPNLKNSERGIVTHLVSFNTSKAWQGRFEPFGLGTRLSYYARLSIAGVMVKTVPGVPLPMQNEYDCERCVLLGADWKDEYI